MSACRSRPALVAGIVLVASLASVAIPVVAQTEELGAGSAATVVPPGEEPLGVPYAKWGTRWWEWIQNVPPIEDLEVSDCQAGQGGEVFHIPHVPPGVTTTTQCTVGADQWLLAVAGGTIWDTSAGSASQDELVALVEADIPIFSEPSITIDGVELADIEDYWLIDPAFTIQYGMDNPYDLPAGTWRAAMGGWFAMIPPLEPGAHTIVVRDLIDLPDDDQGPLVAELTAEVTVEPAE